MTRVQVGPKQIALHQGETVLITTPDGEMQWPSEKGLFFRDTRVISSWHVYANGVSWELLNGATVAPHVGRIFLTNPAFKTENGPVAARTLGLAIERHLDGGMHEDLNVTNHSGKPVCFNLEISIRADFADIFEVKSGDVVRRGHIKTAWSEDDQILRMSYVNKDFSREVIIAIKNVSSHAAQKAVYANGRLSFEIALAPNQTWRCCMVYDLTDCGTLITAPPDCLDENGDTHHGDAMDEWRSNVLQISAGNEEFYRFYHQGLQDIAALRLPLQVGDRQVFVVAAGLPWFVALFGRDTLIASLQTMIVHSDFARGALDALGALQATERDDWRDAQPGKILHELRRGELAHFKLVPHTPYYGTADATPLYLITLHATWRATGDHALLERHLRTAENCLSWIDDYGDLDGDGFQEYQTRSAAGCDNMSWKDSGDSVMYPDGTLVQAPKALCELQGYVYDAWIRMAEIFDALAMPEKAIRLRDKAAILFERFNAAFWNEEEGFYALALDAQKKQVMSVASNPGHCLWSGIVPPDRAARVVARLMQPDMWSGWGIRTLSSAHAAFNPYNYQTGAVWPHDNAIIALGFRRYGFAQEAAAIAQDISEAAGEFLLNQLPELYAGLQRENTSFPVQYIGANVPQAWAAGTSFTLLRAMLGIQQDAPAGKLYLDPVLPAWLPDVTLKGLTLGNTSFTIRFWRDGEQTRFVVEDGPRDAVSFRSFGQYPV